MPFMHAEDLAQQLLGKTLLESLALRVEAQEPGLNLDGFDAEATSKYLRIFLPYAQRHVDCVKELGRFPKRNEALGRETTPQERLFLEKHPDGI